MQPFPFKILRAKALVQAAFWILLSTFALQTSCRRQVKPQTQQTLNWVPAASRAIVWIPKPEQAIANAVQWAQSCGTQLFTRQQLNQFIQRSLQIELTQDKVFEQFGLLEGPGLVGFVPPTQREVLWVAAVHDAKQLDKSLRFFSQKFLSAQDFETTHLKDIPIVSATYPFGSEKIPALHWALVDDCVVLALADGQQALIDFIQNRGHTPTLQASLWTDTQRTLPRGHAYFKLSNTDSAQPFWASGLLASLRWDQQGVAADAELQVHAKHADSLRMLFADPPPAQPQPRYLPDGSWLLTRTGADMQAAAYLQLLHTPTAHTLLGPIQKRLENLDLWDTPKLWESVAGPAALSVRPAVNTDLSFGSLSQARDPWAPLWQWTWIAKLQDSGKMQAFFTKWYKQHQHLRTVKHHKAQIGTQHTDLYRFDDPDHPLAWAVYPPYWVVTTGKDSLVDLVQDLAQHIETNAKTPSTLAFEDAWKSESGSFGLLYGAHIAQSLRNSWRDLTYNPNQTIPPGQPALIHQALQLIENIGTLGVRVQFDPNAQDPNGPQHLNLQLRERTG